MCVSATVFIVHAFMNENIHLSLISKTSIFVSDIGNFILYHKLEN